MNQPSKMSIGPERSLASERCWVTKFRLGRISATKREDSWTTTTCGKAAPCSFGSVATDGMDSPFFCAILTLWLLQRSSQVQTAGDCLLLTAYCLLLTAYCLLPTAYCLLLTAYCFRRITVALAASSAKLYVRSPPRQVPNQSILEEIASWSFTLKGWS